MNAHISESTDHPRTSASAGRDAAVDELRDKQAILEVLHRYCRGIDRRDWELVRSCYHADCHDDHAVYQGDRDGFVDWVSGFLTANFDATRHTLTNVLISVDGDNAGAESYVHAWHRFKPEHPDAPPRDLTLGARYADRLERRDGEWRLAWRVCVIDWNRIETTTESFDLGPDAIYSRTDRDDVSYSVLGRGEPSR
jgi:hypothetical protein